MVQEEKQEEGSWVMASLISMRACAWACTTAMSSEEEEAGAGATAIAIATATISAGIAEFTMIVRIARRGNVRGRFDIS